MKIAHVCNYAPNLSGMYHTVRDLVLAERKLGEEAEFIDDVGELKNLYGKDGIHPVPTEWGDGADLIIWHHAMVQDWFNEQHRNIVLFLHGTPEFNLFTELYDKDSTLSLIIGLANKNIPKAFVSMWKRHVPIWENLLQKKVHYIPPWTTVKEWQVSDRKAKKDVIKIAMMDFWRTTREPFGIIQAISQLKKMTKKKIEVDVWGLTDTPDRTWQAVIQWLINDGTMKIRGRSVDVQKDVFDTSDMIVTMSTEETRVVREAYAAGVPIVCGRGNMAFTKYAEDGLNPDLLAGAINQCHEDLCKRGVKLRKELRKYAEDNFDSLISAREVIKVFNEVIEEHGSINHPKIKNITSRVLETAERIKTKLIANQACAYVNFHQQDLDAIQNDKTDVGKGLKKAFKYQDKTREFFPCLNVGMLGEGRMRPYLFGNPVDHEKYVRIAQRNRSNEVFENANALSYISVYDPRWFVDTVRKCIQNKRVMFVGRKGHCESPLIKCMFRPQTYFTVEGDFAGFMKEHKNKFEQQAQVHDIILCAKMGHASILLAYDLWNKGIRTTFLDLDHIPDALCGINEGWAGMFDENYINNYRMAFLPAKTDIVVVTHKSEDRTKKCFNSIAEHTDNYRTIWVDNGSGDESRSEIRKDIKLKECELINIPDNRGYAVAANRGLRKFMFDGSAEWVVTLDNDTVVTRNWLMNMINTAVASDYDIISPIMSDGVTSISALTPIVSLPTIETNDPEEIAKILNTRFGAAVTRISRASLACCLINKRAVEQLGLFDENLFVMGVENDFFKRALRLNLTIGVSLGTYVHHTGKGTSRTERQIREEDAKHRKYLAQKWSYLDKDSK